MLFLAPQLLCIRSLRFVEDSKISPSVVIGLIAAVFSSATSALLTRAVEHSVWLKLTPKTVRTTLTVAECHRLAQWSVSPLGRFNYIFSGCSWSLRFGGMLLFALAIIDPVLLSGVSPRISTTRAEEIRVRSKPQLAGFLDRSNNQYNGGQFRDNLMSIASLAQLTGLSAPPSKVCTNTTCHMEARAASIRAQCKAQQLPNPKQLGTQSFLSTTKAELCSDINPDVCVTLVKSDPATFAAFTTGYPRHCDGYGQQCPGRWATLFGAWVNAVDAPYNATLPINIVDCSLTFGNVSIEGTGGRSPTIKPSSFVLSSMNYNDLPAGAYEWRRIYTEQPNTYSPYSFSGVAGGAAGADTLYNNTLGLLLLNYADAKGSTALEVASQIEANFEYGTLFAFSREPHAAHLIITSETNVAMWHYNAKVLAILVVPLLATLLVMWRRWSVGDDEIVIGYLPVDIAKKGPVEPAEILEKNPYWTLRRHETDSDREERTLVWVSSTDESSLDQMTKGRLITRLFD